MTYERYWDEVIERIMDSPWWNSPRPNDETEGAVWDGRAAMLDVIFYEPEKKTAKVKTKNRISETSNPA